MSSMSPMTTLLASAWAANDQSEARSAAETGVSKRNFIEVLCCRRGRRPRGFRSVRARETRRSKTAALSERGYNFGAAVFQISFLDERAGRIGELAERLVARHLLHEAIIIPGILRFRRLLDLHDVHRMFHQ